MGKVYLVGAGPGDSGLFTLKGKRLLNDAEVVVYDRLVSQEILNMANPSAKMIDVGKNAGYHKVKQSEINNILVRWGKNSDKVVRLKGGDPFIFGRGGEEIQELIANGVDYEEVPGITSAISAPSYAGIPPTHRDFASSLHIITGHLRDDKEISLDYEALTRLEGTLVFLMSVKSAGVLATGLMNAGMPEDMPCGIIENGTLSSQRSFRGKLKDLEDIVKDNCVKSPAVIIVGKVCDLDFNWFEKLPLRGKKFVVAMPYKNTSKMANLLKSFGAEVLEYPVMDIEFIRPLNYDLKKFDTLIFTSEAGIESFFEDFYENHDARDLYGKKIATIGSASSRALRKYGIHADFIPEIYSGEALAREIIEKGFIDKNSRILLIRAEEPSRDIDEILSNNSIEFSCLSVYRTKMIENEKVDLNQYIPVFTSSAGVKSFVNSQRASDFKGIKALCIGEKTQDTAKKYGFETVVSQKSTIESMGDKAIEVWGGKYVKTEKIEEK